MALNLAVRNARPKLAGLNIENHPHPHQKAISGVAPVKRSSQKMSFIKRKEIKAAGQAPA